MKKQLFILTSIFSLPIVAASCNNNFSIQINNKIEYGVFHNNLLNSYTKDQLQIINQYTPIFVSKENKINSQDIIFEQNNILINKDNKKEKITKFIPKFKYLQPLKLHFVNNGDFKYIQGDHSLDNLDSYDVLFEKYDYIFEQTQANWPDIFSIFRRIASSELNDALNILNPNFISARWMRAKAWIKNEEQIKYWEDLILLELKRFQFSNLKPIAKVKITPVSYIEEIRNDEFVNAPIIKIDFLNENGESLLSKNIREQEWIIGFKNNDFLLKNNTENQQTYKSLFRDYNSKSNFNHTLNIDDDEILFNEYVNAYFGSQTLLSYTNPLALTDNQYEFYVNPSFNFNKATARSFLWFLNNDEQYFNLEVPPWRKHIDAKYEIIDKKINNEYLNATNSLIELKIKVTTKHGEIKYFKWYSIDINAHYHTFAQYKITPDLNFKNPILYGWKEGLPKEQKNLVKKVIDPNVFFEQILLKLMSIQVYRFKDNLTLFDNVPMSKFEAHRVKNRKIIIQTLKTLLGLDVFKYLIGLNTDQNTWIDDISVQFNGLCDEPGCVLLKVDLLDKNKNSLLNLQNQKKIIKWYGFNGADNTSINKQISKNNIEDLTLEYLFKNNNEKLTNANNIIDYFAWKE
ncbi:hypothetical protein EG856_01325 [Mycoplasmopsis phocirhinis]|uniref:Lipoprotein n=1 Tax=Mycoplasmopsis phocirhinis TaxID=142650 RepID=A0A4P6MPB6_9BACT|nr:variable surface lipoprotein [Mycoplasmopsis phocirhinis]QBF34566.1 hypothetical protein EG856_01325 [Mycoplasmopsis phocirhinis]